MLLGADVLGRKLVNVEADPPRLVTAHEIELACIEGWWRVVGVDHSTRAQFRRLLPRRMRGMSATGRSSTGRTWSRSSATSRAARLRFSHRKLANLHPAEIADLVEAASHEEGEEIIEAVAQDRELEADVFEELDEHHQLEFIRERPDAQVAAVIARMAADDAADLIVEIEQDRRARILALLPSKHRRQIEALLGYNPSTAGGLMSPDFIVLAPDDPVARRARACAHRATMLRGTLTTVYLRDAERALVGLGADRYAAARRAWARPCRRSPSTSPCRCTTDADLPEVARTMTDYNLVMLPVVDEQGRMVGVVTVDDVLELTLPTGWRRRFGLARD